MQPPHVAIESGVVIDQRLETRGIEVLFAHQIDQHTGIEIAAARPHDHPTGWGQTHAGVNGLAAFNGSETGAIAEMRNYYRSEERRVGKECRFRWSFCQ